MSKLRQLCHWLSGHGPRIPVSEFVPLSHPLRQWADTCPWEEWVRAIDASVARRFPKQHSGGQAPIATRVL